MSRRRHAGRGQALVEFALIIPVFLLIVISIFDLGRAVFAYNSITNASREGVRLAIVNQTPASVTAKAIARAAIAETAAPNVTVAYYDAGPDADPTTNDPCSPLRVGCMAVVTFETTYRPVTPIISQILFPSGVTLKATSIEAIEHVCPNSTTTSANCPKQP
jgi:Flp pilus assembly protein TadG